MSASEYIKRYRFFGIELRILFWLVVLLFVLAAVTGFRSSVLLSMLFLLMCILSVLFVRVDSSYHLVVLTAERLVFEKVIWRRLSTSFVYIPWTEVEKITTTPYGAFSLLKCTQIESKGKHSIKVYSFMEDYLLFLRDLINQAKSAQVDKLTLDLPAGRADV
ncbi:MAG: hypothetical protein WCE90_10055 [Candidatus Zixiibacteriota bacterium]